jgi:hypothetical protein
MFYINVIYLEAISRCPLYLFLLATPQKKDAASIGANHSLMQTFVLSQLFRIIGIGAASGLAFHDQKLFLISDASNYLYEYDMEKQQLTKNVLTLGGLENIPKKLKADFEALVYEEGKLYIFGSGSTPNRNKMLVVDAKSKKIILEKDLVPLYSQMQKISGITGDDFNIEGVVHHQNTWYFFQRGNGPAGQNGIFTVGDIFENTFTIAHKNFPLPKIGSIAATFTDAVVVNDKIYFLATSEDSQSVYDDGEILGSIVGCIDIKNLELLFTEIITDTHKFEGITFFGEESGKLSFRLCEDNDTETLESGIYKLTLH